MYFDHLLIVVDQPTYAALMQSPLLQRDFSNFYERSTVTNGGKDRYSGLYVMGRRTSLEIMTPGPESGPRGILSFGMWIDDRRQLPALLEQIAATTGTALQLKTTTIPADGRDVPWYDSIEPTRPVG